MRRPLLQGHESNHRISRECWIDWLIDRSFGFPLLSSKLRSNPFVVLYTCEDAAAARARNKKRFPFISFPQPLSGGFSYWYKGATKEEKKGSRRERQDVSLSREREKEIERRGEKRQTMSAHPERQCVCVCVWVGKRARAAACLHCLLQARR